MNGSTRSSRPTNLYFFPIVKEQPIALLPNSRSEHSTLYSLLISSLPYCASALRVSPLIAIFPTRTSLLPAVPSFGLLSSDSWTGGGERDRTDDPLLAKQVL